MPRIFPTLGRATVVYLGTAVAGTLTFLPLLVLIALAQGSEAGEVVHLLMLWLPAVLVLVALATAVGLLAVGLPVMVALRAAAKEGGASYAWAGAFGGYLLAIFLNGGGDPMIPNGIFLPVGAVYGAVAGFLFWKVFRKDKAVRPGG